MNNQRSILYFVIILLLAAVVLVGLTWANFRFATDNPGGNDFLARWTGAHFWLVEGLSPYDPQVSLEAQRMIYGRAAVPGRGEDVAHFVYPLHSMLFFGPFGLLDFTLARAIWMTVIQVSLIALAFVSLRLVEWKVSPIMAAALVIFTLLWYHGMRTVMVGQFAAVNALLIVLSLYLIRQNQDLGAGILLALSTTKPQMSFLIIPFVFLWAISVRRWGILTSFLASLGLMLVASLALIPDWPLQMIWQMLDYPSYTDIGSPLSIVASAAPGISSALSLVLNGLVIIYLIVEWVLAWGKDDRWFLWTALLTLVLTNLVAFRTATTNYVMLLPVLFLIFKVWDERWGVAGKVLMWVTLVGLAVGLWVLFLNTVDGNIEHPIMYLPLPIFCLIGLWWVRWWAVRPPRMLFEEYAARLGS